MRCAERTGTSMMLWIHEFYMFIEPDPTKPSGAPKPYLYKALEFKHGLSIDPKELEGWGKKQKEEVG
jgi:hypothetical protein